jgi:DNA-binding protein Fis
MERAFSEKPKDLYRRGLLRFDSLIVAQAMSACAGHQTNAAELLGISRPTLRAKLRMIESESLSDSQ